MITSLLVYILKYANNDVFIWGKSMSKLFYKFPAIKGLQADEEFYTCMVPLGLLGKIFVDTDNDVMPEFRAQRKLNEARIPDIKNYILNNRNSYVFSALAASIDGEIHFVPSCDNDEIGILEINMNSKILINDGQHRKAAILAAIEEDETLGQETIAVVLYKDKGLMRSQQMFTDLNKHAVNTSKSLNALYDSKDQCSIITKRVLNNVDFLNKYTDKEKDNLGKFSQMLFTLNNLVNANRRVVKSFENANLSSDSAVEFLTDFWKQTTTNINEWNDLERREISKKELRENFIITQGIAILALGYLADYFFNHKEYSMDEYLTNLRNIDWSRNNKKCWLGCAIKINGRINRTNAGINLTFLRIKSMIGLPLFESERSALERSKK